MGFCVLPSVNVALLGKYFILALQPKNKCKDSKNMSSQSFNLLATDFFFQILAHPVFKL